MISTPTLLGLIYRFPNPFPKIAWFTVSVSVTWQLKGTRLKVVVLYTTLETKERREGKKVEERRILLSGL
jgi:hypothetical protein